MLRKQQALQAVNKTFGHKDMIQPRKKNLKKPTKLKKQIKQTKKPTTKNSLTEYENTCCGYHIFFKYTSSTASTKPLAKELSKYNKTTKDALP